MTIRLRPHHLLCVLTYVGRGYDARFVSNFDGVVARLSAGEDILVVDGPDDICRPLLVSAASVADADASADVGADAGANAPPHCLCASVVLRDAQAALDVGELLGIDLPPGATLRFDGPFLARLRAAFAAGTIRRACAGCQWSTLCSEVAGDRFAATSLRCDPADLPSLDGPPARAHLNPSTGTTECSPRS